MIEPPSTAGGSTVVVVVTRTGGGGGGGAGGRQAARRAPPPSTARASASDRDRGRRIGPLLLSVLRGLAPPRLRVRRSGYCGTRWGSHAAGATVPTVTPAMTTTTTAKRKREGSDGGRAR